MPSIRVEIADRIALLTVDRQEKLNALNSEVLSELESALDSVRTDPAVGAVVITGAGPKAFIAGADIGELAKLSPLPARAHALRGQAVLSKIENLGKPVIAAINGFALGGGCELALACTLRIASENAKLGQPEVRLGILPGFGGSQRLPRLVGKGKALELLLTGEPISAEEAHRIGLVNKVVPAGEAPSAAREIAKKILANGPLAVARTIEACNRGLDMSLEDGLFLEATLFGLCASSSDMKEGMAAFLEKRPARFEGK
jgi:enoyl-CoA hydratase